MTFRFPTFLCCLILLSLSCESKPAVDPDAPKSPEWESCIADIEAYTSCKIDEAGQIDEGLVGRTKKQMTIKTNQSMVSEEKCTSVLAALPADDDCVPSE